MKLHHGLGTIGFSIGAFYIDFWIRPHLGWFMRHNVPGGYSRTWGRWFPWPHKLRVEIFYENGGYHSWNPKRGWRYYA